MTVIVHSRKAVVLSLQLKRARATVLSVGKSSPVYGTSFTELTFFVIVVPPGTTIEPEPLPEEPETYSPTVGAPPAVRVCTPLNCQYEPLIRKSEDAPIPPVRWTMSPKSSVGSP